MKNNAQIANVIIRLNIVEYFIVSLKLDQFLEPYATPETVIVAIPIAIQGRKAIEINLHAIVNEATSPTPAVVIIKKFRIIATIENIISSIPAGSETTVFHYRFLADAYNRRI